jgi:hypothetical protein
MHRMCATAVLIAMVGAATATAKEAPLRASVSPSFATAPASLRVRAMVEPADDNRALDIVADSGGYFRSSRIELSGAEAARTHTIEFRAMPEGAYQVLVILRGHDDHARATLSYQVVVVG